ncbi:MAG: sigma-70 family RNA polymerase sigma factor [Candidatus Udaeobacter sp.]
MFFDRFRYYGHVQPLPETVAGLGDSFASTHWSVIVAAGKSESDPERAHAALTQLCQTYWTPLYSFVRSRGYSTHDAQDLTQSFFAFLIERRIYTRVDRQKGSFRSFLLASLKNLLANTYDHAHAFKRGGEHEFLPLDEEQLAEAESRYEMQSYTGDEAGEDKVFERTWAETLVRESLGQLSSHYKTEGQERLFEELRIFLIGSPDPLPSYADLARRLGIQASTLRSIVTRLRARYREALRSEVRRTVETDEEVDAELRELLRILTTA